ncbi:MAG: hypothetical protein FJ098_06945, partial [Deltaproteobacteria bacterium]|nr:hypothetical protein [Deltaproteobacteria bacterium]
MRSTCLVVALLAACGPAGGTAPPEDLAPAADAVADAREAPFRHQIYSHTEAAGLHGLAIPGAQFSGEDEESPRFALEYPPIPVDPRYTHVLNFLHTPFLPPWRHPIPTHGPLILFSEDLDTLVFSPVDHFFVGLVELREGAIHYGIWGEVDEVPEGFVHRFVLVEGRGINATVEEWGRLLREDHGRDRVDRYADRGLSHLSYWTDNGAYYYYRTEEGMNEQETLLAVKDDADSRGIPLGSMQLDSWWYFKAAETPLFGPSGLVLWEPRPEMFPGGLAAFQELLGLPLIAHNRWFHGENDYLDEYDFLFEEDRALPTGPGIFQHFMQDLASWGGITYEQDWLITQYWDFTWLRDGVDHASSWMGWMDAAAAAEGLTMQLCMPGAAHLMDSLDRTAATTTRTSTDYRNSDSKESFWPEFHTVNMIAWALGLLPFKDNFWSSEDHGEAEALVSILSAGMVGLGDPIGAMDRGLVLRTCRQDGLLLKPDRPATPLDTMFLDHERPFLVSTWSERPELGRTVYLAAFHLASAHPERGPMDIAYAAITYDEKPLESIFVFPAEVTDWTVDPARDLGIDGRRYVVYDWVAGTAAELAGPFTLSPMPHLYDY